jgi:hypothetical protein
MNNEDATGIVSVWDLGTGQVRELCRYPDTHMQSVNLTRSGKIVAVNVYGVFFRFDLASGALESSIRLPAAALGPVDRLCRIDRDRILGTPFITHCSACRSRPGVPARRLTDGALCGAPRTVRFENGFLLAGVGFPPTARQDCAAPDETRSVPG